MAQQTGAKITAEAVVIGAGPAGLTAAIALAVGGIETVLVAKRPERPDNRTSALLAGSVAALEVLGVWDACRAHAAPLRTIRLVDDTRRLLRAPEISFSADEIDLEAFGHNIENRHLVAALWDRVDAASGLTHIDCAGRSVEIESRREDDIRGDARRKEPGPSGNRQLADRNSEGRSKRRSRI